MPIDDWILELLVKKSAESVWVWTVMWNQAELIKKFWNLWFCYLAYHASHVCDLASLMIKNAPLFINKGCWVLSKLNAAERQTSNCFELEDWNYLQPRICTIVGMNCGSEYVRLAQH